MATFPAAQASRIWPSSQTGRVVPASQSGRAFPAGEADVPLTPSKFMLFSRAHGASTNVNAGTTTLAYEPPGSGAEYGGPSASSTWAVESRVLAVAPVDMTLSGLMNRTWANSLSTAAVTFRSRNNGANGTQVNTVAAGSTASVEDTTHTDAVTAGNTFCTTMQLASGGTGTYTPIGARMVMTPTTDATKHWALYTTLATAILPNISRSIVPGAWCQTAPPLPIVWRCASTIESIRIPVTSNTLSVTATFDVYKNGSSTGITGTITSGSTTTLTLSGPIVLADGDTFEIQVTSPAGTGALSLGNINFWVSADRATPKAMMIGYHSSGETAGVSGRTFFAIAGSLQTDDTTESRVSIPHGFTGKSSKLAVDVITNGTGGVTTALTFRAGGADTALTLSVPALGVGIYTDVTHEATWGPTDECSYALDRSSSANINIRSITTVEEYVSG